MQALLLELATQTRPSVALRKYIARWNVEGIACGVPAIIALNRSRRVTF